MKLGGGRNKGNSFERKVAGLVVKAFKSFGITKKDVYRTPSSGGHRYAKDVDPGDLVMTPEMRKLFPAHVECKHYRRVDLWQLLHRQQKRSWKFQKWAEQASVAGTVDGLDPVVVFKGNGAHPILCMYKHGGRFSVSGPSLHTRLGGNIWEVCLFSELLRTLSLVEKVRRKK